MMRIAYVRGGWCRYKKCYCFIVIFFIVQWRVIIKSILTFSTNGWVCYVVASHAMKEYDFTWDTSCRARNRG